MTLLNANLTAVLYITHESTEWCARLIAVYKNIKTYTNSLIVLGRTVQTTGTIPI